MEAQAGAERDGPFQPIGRDIVPRRHLRVRAQRAVGAVERIEDAIGMRRDDGGGVEDRIEHGQRCLLVEMRRRLERRTLIVRAHGTACRQRAQQG